jgi:hypothetical protein
MSVVLYAVALRYDLHFTAFPNGFWSFNPFAWQMLFVFGAWCALGGAQRMSRVLASPVTLWIAGAYLLAAFCVTLTWYFPQLEHVLPLWLERLIYPINKADLDILRFAHFVALAVVAVRLVPAGSPVLTSRWLWPMILCGQNSLEIFCLGVALGFTGYFVLTELAAGIVLHVLIGIAGVAIMSGGAWLLSWSKHNLDKKGPRARPAGGNAAPARTTE